MDDRKPVGIWIRVSTQEQAEGESPEHHEKRARYYAEAKGWDICEVYHLEGVSGKAVMEHPETIRMLHDIRSRRITGLIFSKLARLARSTKELLELSDIFRSAGADLISLQESIDTTSPAGRLLYTMIAALAEWERSEIAERVAASVPIRAKLGKSTGGAATLGYQWKDGQLVPDPSEAPVRRRVYELFREHRRKKAVARLMNEEGHRTRSGARFSDTTVERLLTDPTPKGLRRANYTKSTGDGKHWELKAESDWVLTPVEAIVDPELWEECNRILAGQRAQGRRPARKAVHLFGGLTVCSCGTKMYVPSNTPKYVCHSCRNKIPIEDLEGIFHHRIKGFLFSDEELAGYLADAHETIGEKDELIAALGAERAKLAREMDKLYELYLANGIGREAFTARHRPLEERLAQIDDALPAAMAERDVQAIQFLSREEVISEARDLHSRWEKLSPSEKRTIVETITEKIVVGDGEVEIHLSYSPQLPTPPTSPDQRPLTPSNSGSSGTPGRKATQPQGFSAPTSWKRAGSSSAP